ncbi:MAG: LysR substrate-binding domain-containing protein [Burkholderiaceae bacterium]
MIAPTSADGTQAADILRANPYLRFAREARLSRLIDQALLRQHLQIESAMEIGTLDAVLALVQAGLGVSVVPAAATGWLPAGVRAVMFGDPPLTRQVALLERTSHGRQALVAMLLEAIGQPESPTASRPGAPALANHGLSPATARHRPKRLPGGDPAGLGWPGTTPGWRPRRPSHAAERNRLERALVQRWVGLARLVPDPAREFDRARGDTVDPHAVGRVLRRLGHRMLNQRGFHRPIGRGVRWLSGNPRSTRRDDVAAALPWRCSTAAQLARTVAIRSTSTLSAQPASSSLRDRTRRRCSRGCRCRPSQTRPR